jgi:hypothetical protein
MADQPEFFIDRSLGRKTVPEALRAHGLVVHTMADVYGERIGQGLKDEVWLRDVGERGWVVLMRTMRSGGVQQSVRRSSPVA